MTCLFDPDTGNVYDHTGSKVGNVDNVSGWDGVYPSGGYPSEVLDVLREAMDGSKPSAYNQALLADMASENIEQGVPQ